MTRIDGLNPQGLGRAAPGQGADGVDAANGRQSAPGPAGGAADRVNLSERGRTVADAARAVHDAPDVRADRVAELKAAIADGTYRSNARDIAARLLAAGLDGA